MQPNLATTRDPLKVEFLPDSVGRMELNYRTATDPRALPPFWCWSAVSVLSIAVLFVVRLLLQLQASGLQCALVGSVAVFLLGLAALAYKRHQFCRSAVTAFAAPVVLLVASTPGSPAIAWIGLLFAIATAALFAGALVAHAAAWYSADLRMSISGRKRFLAVWSPTAMINHARNAGAAASTARLREMPEQGGMRGRLHALIIASLAASTMVWIFPSYRQSQSMLLLLAVFCGASAFVSIRDFCRTSGQTPRSAASSILRAFSVWFGYNRHETLAPGVMRSPSGFVGRRKLHFWIAFALFCGTSGFAASYFSPSLRGAGAATRRTHSGQVDAVGLGKSLDAGIQRVGAALRRCLEGRILLGAPAEIAHRWPTTVLALAACTLIPPLAFIAIVLALCGRTLAHFGHVFGENSPYLRDITEWHAAVERLQNSRDRLESEHIWLGVAVKTDSPVIMHRQLAAEHVHLLGSTGSNKTSVGVTQLLEQLIGPQSSLLILDLKGDMALFEAARLKAAQSPAGLCKPVRFRWFTTESDRTSFVFNPLSQSYMQRLPNLERTQILARAIGLEHGEGYGRGHFSSQNRNALLKLLSCCPEIDSFRKLHEEGRRQKKLFTTWEREHASDFFSAIHTLANIDALNVTQRDSVDPAVVANAIDMSELVREPTIAYFRLPATSQAAANREVGKLALYGLLTAVRQLGRSGRQIYIVVDEFQQLVSVDLAIILQQARSYGIGIIMAHQTQSDLKLPETDMTQVVEENTHFKQIFSVNDLGHRQALEALSGEALYHLAGWTQGYEAYADSVLFPNAGLPDPEEGDDFEINVTPSIGPRLRANDLIEMSARPNLCMVQFKRNVGYGQYDGFPFLMRTDYHIARDEYQRRLSASWPAADSAAGLIVAPLPSECFFYQIGVEKPSNTKQIPLPFIGGAGADTDESQPAPALTNSSASSGEITGKPTERNPIADALDSL